VVSMEKTSRKIGVNLAGWISQYPAYGHVHLRNFNPVADSECRANGGSDQIRLTFDRPILEYDKHPVVEKESICL